MSDSAVFTKWSEELTRILTSEKAKPRREFKDAMQKFIGELLGFEYWQPKKRALGFKRIEDGKFKEKFGRTLTPQDLTKFGKEVIRQWNVQGL